MEVYAAFHSVPDFSAGHPPFVGVAMTLDSAIKLLYPEGDVEFRPSPLEGNWHGPDGFGEVRRVELHGS